MKSRALSMMMSAGLALSLVAMPGCTQQSGTAGSAAEQEPEEPQYADEAFLEAMARGLEARWALAGKETYATTDEEVESLTKMVNAELDEISGFTSEPFEDSKLQEKAIQYINLLKDQLAALDYAKVDYAKYNELWSTAYNARPQASVDIADNYALNCSEENQETLKDMRLNASMVTEKEEKQKKIEELTASFDFQDEGDGHYVAVVENTTGFDIKDYGASVILYDADGVNVDSQYVSVKDWANGQKAKLDFYVYGVEFATYKVNIDWWE